MYADFELILKPIQGPNPEPMGPYTSKVTKQGPPLVGAFTANLCTKRLKIH